MKILLSLILIVLLNNCSEMKPEDYKDTKPVLKIEEYFEGKSLGHAFKQIRSG